MDAVIKFVAYLPFCCGGLLIHGIYGKKIGLLNHLLYKKIIADFVINLELDKGLFNF